MSVAFAKGASLIEVLVASSILVTGILSLFVLQTSALGTGIVSAHRQQASLLLQEIVELSQVDPVTFREIDPVTALASEGVLSSCPQGSMCPPAAFMHAELSAWVSRVKNRLPAAQIDIQPQSYQGQPGWVVSLNWHGPAEFSQSSMQTGLQL